jgi:sterol desaturase/sphingolipid hydroxylase (fatty acid hydroxylase superfamily)
MATAALFGIAPGVLIYVWFAFAGQIVVLEDIGYGRALGRSRQLVKRSWWRVFVILLLASFIIELAQTACLIGAQAVAGSGSFVTVAASTAITLLTAPILGLITALLYFDLRLRHDGSDIRAAIRAL